MRTAVAVIAVIIFCALLGWLAWYMWGKFNPPVVPTSTMTLTLTKQPTFTTQPTLQPTSTKTITPEPSVTVESTPTPTVVPVITVRVNTGYTPGWLHFRSGAGIKYYPMWIAIGAIPEGAEVTFLSCEYAPYPWAHVEYNGRKGYVYSPFTSPNLCEYP